MTNLETTMFTVLKPFPHPTRRFAVGDTVTEADLAECAIGIDTLKSRGFIAPEPTDTGSAGKRRRT